MKVRIKKLDEKAVVPRYGKPGDAGLDLTAINMEVQKDFQKKDGEVNEVTYYIEYGTGLAFEIPEGHVGLIFPRSSISNKDLILSNSVGVIDSGYRGEVKFRFKLINFDSYDQALYKVGDRIGQLLIVPYPTIELEEVDDLSSSERGEGGYGSTGE